MLTCEQPLNGARAAVNPVRPKLDTLEINIYWLKINSMLINLILIIDS